MRCTHNLKPMTRFLAFDGCTNRQITLLPSAHFWHEPDRLSTAKRSLACPLESTAESSTLRRATSLPVAALLDAARQKDQRIRRHFWAWQHVTRRPILFGSGGARCLRSLSKE